MAGNLDSFEDSDVLMLDPFLDYINDILMEEGMDDATYMQQVHDASYQAIFGGFHDILREQSTPNLCGDSASHEDVFDPHLLRPDQHHVKVTYRNVGLTDELHNIVGAPRVSLPFNGHPRQSSVAAQNHHNAIKLNDGVLMDAKVSCWGKDAVVEGLRDHVGQEQGNAKFKLPSLDEEFPSKLTESDLSFQDLKLDDVYTDLYVGGLSASSVPAKDSKHNGEKKESLARKGSKFGKKRTSEVQVFVDVREVLVSCAKAVAIGDARSANEILQELHQVHGASANGTGVQRTAYIFSKALAARMRGMGEHEYRAVSLNMPSLVTLLWASKVGLELSPVQKVMHYFANQSILKAAEGASRLHVVDYGLLYGMQWPCLINALADRKGGPPLLVITGIEFPRTGVNMAERLHQSGRRLAAYAKSYNVPFQYHAIVTNKSEDLDAASLHCHEGEVLVLNSIKRLTHLADGSAKLPSTISPRQKLLTCMHSLNPHLLVTAVASAASNSPFFVTRFREALYYYSNAFDMLDTLYGDIPQRLILERSWFYHEIINIVACEGAERLGRPETYKQWHDRIAKAGFEQLPIPSTILARSKSYVKQHYHKDFLIHDDAIGWMLIGWKGRIVFAISAWKPCLV